VLRASSWYAASSFHQAARPLGPPAGVFSWECGLRGVRDWVLEMQASRRERNVRLAARLQELGSTSRWRKRRLAARNDRAATLCRDHGGEGYATSYRQAFDDYLDESAKGYVYRHEPRFAEAVARILKAGGIASLAHPVRVKATCGPDAGVVRRRVERHRGVP